MASAFETYSKGYKKIDAPNFAPAIAALADARDSFNTGLTAARLGVDNFYKNKDDAYNSELSTFMANALADPASFEKQFKDAKAQEILYNLGSNPAAMSSVVENAKTARQLAALKQDFDSKKHLGALQQQINLAADTGNVTQQRNLINQAKQIADAANQNGDYVAVNPDGHVNRNLELNELATKRALAAAKAAKDQLSNDAAVNYYSLVDRNLRAGMSIADANAAAASTFVNDFPQYAAFLDTLAKNAEAIYGNNKIIGQIGAARNQQNVANKASAVNPYGVLTTDLNNKDFKNLLSGQYGEEYANNLVELFKKNPDAYKQALESSNGNVATLVRIMKSTYDEVGKRNSPTSQPLILSNSNPSNYLANLTINRLIPQKAINSEDITQITKDKAQDIYPVAGNNTFAYLIQMENATSNGSVGNGFTNPNSRLFTKNVLDTFKTNINAIGSDGGSNQADSQMSSVKFNNLMSKLTNKLSEKEIAQGYTMYKYLGYSDYSVIDDEDDFIDKMNVITGTLKFLEAAKRKAGSDSANMQSILRADLELADQAAEYLKKLSDKDASLAASVIAAYTSKANPLYFVADTQSNLSRYGLTR